MDKALKLYRLRRKCRRAYLMHQSERLDRAGLFDQKKPIGSDFEVTDETRCQYASGTHAVLIVFGIMLIDYSFARLFCTLERGNWSREWNLNSVFAENSRFEVEIARKIGAYFEKRAGLCYDQ